MRGAPEEGDADGRRPTIRDVAKAADVSKSLVSLVLQGSDRVSDESRRDVLEVAARLGYQRNRVAQSLSLRSGRSGVVAVLVADLGNPWLVSVVAALRGRLEARGLNILVSPAETGLVGEGRLDVALLELLKNLRVDGAVVVGSAPELDLMEHVLAPIPVVVAGAGSRAAGWRVSNDNSHGMRLVVDHLQELGHRRIAFAGGADGGEAAERQTGYRAAMERAGLELETLVADAGFSEDSGRRAAAKLLSAEDIPTAIVGANDQVAVGVLSALQHCGLACPRDVAVTGYDDTPLARTDVVSLTSVRQDAGRIGHAAADAVLRLLASPDGLPPDSDEIIQPALVSRRTTLGS